MLKLAVEGMSVVRRLRLCLRQGQKIEPSGMVESCDVEARDAESNVSIYAPQCLDRRACLPATVNIYHTRMYHSVAVL